MPIPQIRLRLLNRLSEETYYKLDAECPNCAGTGQADSCEVCGKVAANVTYLDLGGLE